MLTRRNVYGLGGDWPAPLLWYARGVAAMKARALAEPTSWRFYAAIHGFNKGLWTGAGYLKAGEAMPTSANQKRYWNQCQHGSWYFLPWHRGYLLAFEQNVRAAIVALKGPADWTLPYWNYFKPDQNKLPPAFATPDWPDGKGNNPLYVPQRYGPQDDGNVYVDLADVNLKAMADPDFTGVASGGAPGFGGVDTGFEHGGRTHGGIETQPHDWVHGLVGGGDETRSGLMSDPRTAALDPIFWLHHANIDRLWDVWRKNPPTDQDPKAPAWLKGPASVGERAFSLPKPDGEPWDYTPADMVDDHKLGYSYDDIAPAAPPDTHRRRLQRLGAPQAATAMKPGASVVTGKSVELVGASPKGVELKGSEASTAITLDVPARKKVTASLSAVARGAAATPDRVFLNLENVTGLADSTAFKVYVGVPPAADAAQHADKLAGSISLFGVTSASEPDGAHGGQGLTFVLDITDIVDALHLQNALDVDKLDVRLVPLRPVHEKAQIRIGRISMFRQGH
ncbi:MAG TPA: tyrosinase family protein [Acidobacteriaceae bacterium]|nr:tyrosinase family protein [Acidobacteriaceae bacterium]